MNVDKFGIVVTLAITITLCCFAGIASGEFVSSSSIDYDRLPFNFTSSTNTNNQYPQDGFYDYCYRMGLEC
tara:strand:- start:413 stop:625 length:213 start_codon:yes stop_codon:yes gene_type:complete